MSQKTVGFIQINNSFADSVYFPYSVGLFQAYYMAYGAHRDCVTFIEPIFERIAAERAVEHLHQCDMIAISAYAWNLALSMTIAETLKKKKPDAIVVVGGPQIPPDTEAFLAQHPYVDIACRGEGERIVTRIIDHLFDLDFSSIPSISWRSGEGIFTTETFERIENLDEIPSPYLTGVFDSLLRNHPDKHWLGLWETNRGCPFSCAFCDWGAPEQRKIYHFNPQRVKDELQWFADNHIEFIFCCDSNFGMYEKDVEYVNFASELKKKTGYPQALSVQNAKNATKRVVLVQENLNKAGLNRGVTLALQSATPEVLANIGRKNISFQSFSELQHTFSRKGIATYTDIILCLPGETYNSFINGIDTIIESGQYNRIQFINLSILPNSLLAKQEYIRKFGLETVDSICMNIHGASIDNNAVPEKQQLVISSASMSRSDWRRTRAWCWMCSLLFFDKLLQIPLTLLSRQTGTPISHLVNVFLEADEARFPLLADLARFFEEQAEIIQGGGPEYVHAPEYLDISWFQDEYQLIRLVDLNKIGQFYTESEELLRLSCELAPAKEPDLLADAVDLNRRLMKFYADTAESDLSVRWNVWEYFRGIVDDRPVSPAPNGHVYRIHRAPEWVDLDEWMKKMVWFGNKPGAYWWPISQRG